jgi:hypothetical protein
MILSLWGCATPRILENDLSVTVTVSTTTFEKETVDPDEFIYIHVFTSDQNSEFDRAKNVTMLKPQNTKDIFFLDSGASYRLLIAFNRFGFLNKTTCIATLKVTPAPQASYHIQFDVSDETNSCTLVFKEKDNILVNETFTKQHTYFIPIIIPM